MREKSKFQKQACQKFHELSDRSDLLNLNPAEIMDRFHSGKQEPVRMGIAAWVFCNREIFAQEQYRIIEAYLKPRIRLAAEFFIEEDDTERLEQMETLGWINEEMLDECLKTARERNKNQALIVLLEIKDKKYGFKDQLHEL